MLVVVVAAVIGLVDFGSLARLYRVYTAKLGSIYGPVARPDFIAAVAALAGVLVFDTLPGLFIGIAVFGPSIGFPYIRRHLSGNIDPITFATTQVGVGAVLLLPLVLITVVFQPSVIGPVTVTFVILLAIKYTVGLRVSEDVEREGLDLSRCAAYSDSSNDIPMLSLVGDPCAVNPDAKLRGHARDLGWRIVDYRTGRKAAKVGVPAAAVLGAVAGIAVEIGRAHV